MSLSEERKEIIMLTICKLLLVLKFCWPYVANIFLLSKKDLDNWSKSHAFGCVPSW
jgi:hypothetical protein